MQMNTDAEREPGEMVEDQQAPEDARHRRPSQEASQCRQCQEDEQDQMDVAQQSGRKQAEHQRVEQQLDLEDQ
jgi:hypothetical protein